MSTGIDALRKLAFLGYRFTLEGETLRAKYTGQGDLDPSQVRPLLTTLNKCKAEVIAYLNLEPKTPPEHLLTCYHCGHFRPDISASDLNKAKGRCCQQDRDIQGGAAVCEAFGQFYPYKKGRSL
jgi:hypothetical protein